MGIGLNPILLHVARPVEFSKTIQTTKSITTYTSTNEKKKKKKETNKKQRRINKKQNASLGDADKLTGEPERNIREIS